jgi:hypothetical protein
MPVPGYLRIEFRDAFAGCGYFGAEFLDWQARHAAFASDDDPESFAAVALDDIQERLVQTAFSQQVHRHSGREREFVFHSLRLKSATIF